MSKIERFTGTAVSLFLDDIDTDRIIPARYLRCVTFDGLGAHVFEDDRKQDAAHPFDRSQSQGAGILVAGRNFGCGSSREHAPQALMRWGIRAVVAESFAEIFFGNCVALGIPAVTAKRSDLESLIEAIAADPKLELTVDLLERKIQFGRQSIPVEIPESAHQALTSGQWDFLSQLLEGEPQIKKSAGEIPYNSNFA